MVVRPEVSVVEHDHGGITLGADVMNGHVNADIATGSSVQSPRREQRRQQRGQPGAEGVILMLLRSR